MSEKKTTERFLHNDEIRDILIRYTENLRDYERESRNMIGFDERDDEEFVDIFLKGEVV